MWNFDSLRKDGLRAFQPITNKKLEILDSLKNSDSELMDYVYSVIKDLPEFSGLPSPSEYTKCNERADECRKIANELYVRQIEVEEALEYYTRAVAEAEPLSESLCLAYMNRSHLLFEQFFFEECAQDIDRALKCDHDENLKRKLLHRREKVEQMKQFQRHSPYHAPIPAITKKNKIMESASDSIKIETNEKWGTHVVATKNIKIGDVLLVESPYVTQINDAHNFFHCHECLELCYNMIACEACTLALYCSKKCMQEAYNSYHKYQCILMQYGLFRRAIFIKLALKSILEYDRFMEDLFNMEDPVYRSDRYKEVYQMETNQNVTSGKDLFENTLEPVLFYFQLTTATDILEELHMDNKEQVLKELVLRNYYIARYNNVCIEKAKQYSVTESNYETVATGIYSCYPNFKHSCYPNARPFFYGNKLVLRATNNIKRGKQVTVSCGISFANLEKYERQLRLQETYKFNCQCIPCVNNWPLVEYLKKGDPIPKKFYNQVNYLLKSGEFYNEDEVNKLLEKAYEISDGQKITTIPTDNHLRLKCIISSLFLSYSNKLMYLKFK